MLVALVVAGAFLLVRMRVRARALAVLLPSLPSLPSHRSGFLWTPVIIQSPFPSGREEGELTPVGCRLCSVWVSK